MGDNRNPKPSAEQRPKPLDTLDFLTNGALRKLIAPESNPVEEKEETTPVAIDEEPPAPNDLGEVQLIDRTFVFVDICDFTKHTDRYGARSAVEVLTEFRHVVRDVTARRGVRVAKWLGDGAMLVSADVPAAVAAVMDISIRLEDADFDIHAGIAHGPVLLFEGDDHIGRAVNLSARLCEAAKKNEVLAYGIEDHIPSWVKTDGKVSIRANGIGDVYDVLQLKVRQQRTAA